MHVPLLDVHIVRAHIKETVTMDKIFGCKPKAKKVDTTVEDLLQENTWIGFQPLGDWVKVIPRQLLTLWTSKDADEVRDTLDQLFSSLNLAREEVSNDEAKKDQLQLLLGLVVKIIEFSWPILKSNDALHKEKLFRKLIDLGESLEVLTDQPYSDGHLSPHLALSKAANFLDDLFASAKDNMEMLQCCASAVIRIPGKAISTDNSLMLKLVERLTTITDDATRACFVFSADKLGKEAGSFIKKVTKRQFTDICNDFLTLPDVSLAKLMAAIATARMQTSKAPAEVLHVLADYLVHFEEYEKNLETTPLKNFMRIHYSTANAVSLLNPACDIFFARVIENMKALDTRPDLSSEALSVAIDMLLTYLMDPIPPGTKVIDLHPSSVRLLKALVELDKVWTNKDILEALAENGIPSTKEELVAFLADNADDGTKRFPKFEGINEIPWHELRHAYGKATDVPECLRMLASPKKESGLRALRYLFSSICHQGIVSSATPYAVPYLVEVLECKLNQEKPNILNLCAFFLKGCRQGYFCSKTGFDVSVEFPLTESRKGEEQEYDDYDYNYCVRMHQIEQHLVNGLPVFLNLLNDTDPLIRSCTAFVLAFLPRVADRSVPKIKDKIHSETDSSVKASLMLSLGMLLPRVSSHEECLQFFNGQWDSVKDSDDETVKFSVAACVGRLLAGKTPPKFVLDQLLKAVGKEDLYIVYQAFDDPFTLALDLIAILKADDALSHIIHQFKKEIQPRSDIRLVLRTMLSIAFRFERENDKPIQPATLKPEQLEVLQAIVDSKGDEWDIHFVLEREFDLPGTKEQLCEFIEKAKAIKDVLEV